jgi:hypothetical protein
VQRSRRLTEISSSERAAALPPAERKALQAKLTELRKDKTVKADGDSRSALAEVRQAEQKAGNAKGKLQDIQSAYLAIAKRWPDTEAGQEAAKSAAALNSKVGSP